MLHPILSVSSDVINITEANSSQRIRTKDLFGEILALAERINIMVDTLEKSKKKLAADHSMIQNLVDKISIEEQKVRTVMNGISDFIITVNSLTGVIITATMPFNQSLTIILVTRRASFFLAISLMILTTLIY